MSQIIADADVDVDLDLENAWNFITNDQRPYQNCPRCDSVTECYAECNKDAMMQFNNIKSWQQCKNTCVNLGGKYAFKFMTSSNGLDIDADADIDLDRDIVADIDVDIGNKPHPDRACAMYRQNTNKCICVQGNVRACKNIGSGMENCPNCGNSLDLGIIGGAPDCLSKCKWPLNGEYAQEFNDIVGWGNCEAKCQSLGVDFRFQFGISDPLDALNQDRACAVYARYNNKETKGKCVCFAGRHKVCVSGVDNVLAQGAHAPPAMLAPDDDIWNPETGASSYDMIEGYGIGVISTLIILLIGIFIAYSCKWRQIATKRASSIKYSKVINVDETTDDERVVIKQ